MKTESKVYESVSMFNGQVSQNDGSKYLANNILKGLNTMKLLLSDHDRKKLDGLVADLEKQTKAQVVLAVVQRSDSYAELPWKAFALGASLAGLVVLILELYFYGWDSRLTALITVAGTLSGGAIFALLTVLFPGFARLFLSDVRAEVEVKQYAQSLFLSRELYATRQRSGVLVLVSLFERKFFILPDKGLADQLSRDAMQNIVTAMAMSLKQNELRHAFETGLDKLAHFLGPAAAMTSENELPDAIIEEEGV
ncbi:MAG: TPM domain-containing protein [Candidatus Zhuqueibacterota bacterium]